MSDRGTVVSVNVGRPTELTIRGRARETGIFKQPQSGPVRIAGVAVGDDVQIERSHGGPFKAVYAYALEDYRWWEQELERELPPGTYGENLTTEGVDWSNALIGERWRVGTAVLEVADPRTPCSTLRARMGIPGFVKTFAAARRFGAYFSIEEEGSVEDGDEIEVVHRPGHEVTIERLGAVKLWGTAAEARAIFEALGRPERRRAWVEQAESAGG